MDFETFRKLCQERAAGTKTELEFWREMKASFEKHQPGSDRGIREKRQLLDGFAAQIQRIEHQYKREQERLALEIEAWLNGPGASSLGGGP